MSRKQGVFMMLIFKPSFATLGTLRGGWAELSLEPPTPKVKPWVGTVVSSGHRYVETEAWPGAGSTCGHLAPMAGLSLLAPGSKLRPAWDSARALELRHLHLPEVFAQGLALLLPSLLGCLPRYPRQHFFLPSLLCAHLAVLKLKDQRGQDAGPRSHSKEEAQTWGWMTLERPVTASSHSSTSVCRGWPSALPGQSLLPRGVFCSRVEAQAEAVGVWRPLAKTRTWLVEKFPS